MFTEPRIEPGSSAWRTDYLPTELHGQTSHALFTVINFYQIKLLTLYKKKNEDNMIIL